MTRAGLETFLSTLLDLLDLLALLALLACLALLTTRTSLVFDFDREVLLDLLDLDLDPDLDPDLDRVFEPALRPLDPARERLSISSSLLITLRVVRAIITFLIE